MTTSIWGKLNALKDGSSVFNHGYRECVALANYYTETLMRLPFVQVDSAFQWWTKYDELPALHDYYTQSDKPVVGALFVSRGGIYDAHDGHIGIVTAVHADGSFSTIEQNAAGDERISRHRRQNDESLFGFLIPRNNPARPKPKKKEDDDMAEPTYIADSKTGTNGGVYRLHPITGKKRLIPSPEWRALRARESAAKKAGKPEPLIIGLVSAADLAKIPNG